MAAFIMLKIKRRYQRMETAEQNTKQFMEENDVLKQFMELLNRKRQIFLRIF